MNISSTEEVQARFDEIEWGLKLRIANYPTIRRLSESAIDALTENISEYPRLITKRMTYIDDRFAAPRAISYESIRLAEEIADVQA